MRLCFDCSCKLMTPQRSVNSYLHMNEWIHMTLHLLYRVSTKSSSHLKYLLHDNQNRHMEPFAYCSVTESLYLCFSTPQHGNPLWPDHIKSLVQFCPCIVQHVSFTILWIVSITLAWRVPVSSTDFLETLHVLTQEEM